MSEDRYLHDASPLSKWEGTAAIGIIIICILATWGAVDLASRAAYLIYYLVS